MKRTLPILAILAASALAAQTKPAQEATVQAAPAAAALRPDSVATADINPTASQSTPEVIITGHEVKGVVDSTVIRTAIDHYLQTRIEGFQQSGLPRFIITGRERKFLLGIGGFINFRASYDFDGAIDNRDFITYDIPVPASPAYQNRFGMDAAASRLFFKAIANSATMGQVESYLEMDFRSQTGSSMRMRYGYIKFWGVLIGRSVTTFCDLSSSPTTVDAEGPNAYSYLFADVIRYTHVFHNPQWSAAISIEAPSASYNTTGKFDYMPQRMPDIPMYVQYEWGGDKRHSHVRLSTVLREMRYMNSEQDKAYGRMGWGFQASGSVKLPYNFTAFGQGAWGRGIARYLQDITSAGLDLVPDPSNADRMMTLPMGGWFVAMQYSHTPRMHFSSGFSQVAVHRSEGIPRDGTYHNAKYFFLNTFLNIGSSCTLGFEYLHGRRIDMDGQKGHANRLEAMIQYDF